MWEMEKVTAVGSWKYQMELNSNNPIHDPALIPSLDLSEIKNLFLCLIPASNWSWKLWLSSYPAPASAQIWWAPNTSHLPNLCQGPFHEQTSPRMCFHLQRMHLISTGIQNPGKIKTWPCSGGIKLNILHMMEKGICCKCWERMEKKGSDHP